MTSSPIGDKPSAFIVLRYLGMDAFRARNKPPSPSDIEAASAAKTFAEELPYLKRLSAQGHPGSQHTLATHYDFGHDIKVNKRLAVELYRLAAEGGEPQAMFDLASSYHIGDGVPENLDLALKWYRAGAEAGEARSMNNLAAFYAAGTDVPLDIPVALKWARRSAETGNANGMHILARLLRREDQADPEADVWLHRAAEAGHREAKVEVTRLQLASALGEDREAGLKALEDLAAKHDYLGLTELARLYEEGTHVAQNLPRAYALLGTAIGLHPLDEHADKPDQLDRMIRMLDAMSEEEKVEAREGVLREGGLKPLLILAYFFRQINIGDSDFYEGETLQWLAIENGAGTMRYAGYGIFTTAD